MPHKRVLVIEGGGMKAAYANGVLTAFEQAGFAPWDAVYGSSAGGALAAWSAARQAEFAEATWDYAADERILSWRRALLRRGPLLDHEMLFEAVYRTEHPLAVGAVQAARHPVVVTASDVDSGEPVYTDVRHSDVLPWLKATGRLPLAAGKPVEIGGRRFLDGGILDPIPVRRAIAEGADDIVLILNRVAGLHRPDPRWLAEWTARRYPKLRQGLLRHNHIKRETIAFALAPPPGVRIHVVRPRTDTRLRRLTRDLDLIHAGLRQGRAEGAAFLADCEAGRSAAVAVAPPPAAKPGLLPSPGAGTGPAA